jgi:crotonobetainyl-CoA:carnitine CoA-transferase CaiB-like acyl-CoA transferase
VTAAVSAWGTRGRWAGRRRFDSIVQAASGIAMVESGDGATPGELPVQALDHATGHFLAAGIALALVRQRRAGGSVDVRMSLARAASALLSSTDLSEEPVESR